MQEWYGLWVLVDGLVPGHPPSIPGWHKTSSLVPMAAGLQGMVGKAEGKCIHSQLLIRST